MSTAATAPETGTRPFYRRHLVVLIVVGVLVAIAIAAGLWLAYGRSDAGAASGSASVQTTLTRVERRDLAETQTFAGTLGYTDDRPISSGLAGTITSIAPEGAIRKRGQVLFRVDNAPVVLMYGTTPAWRALSTTSTDGPDIRELEQNLVALGYDPNHDITVDSSYTAATAAAVDRWQAALGVTQTGTLALGDVVFLPGPRRIGQLSAPKGSSVQAGATVMNTTATTQQVTVQLDTTDQTLAVAGRRVTIDLPDGSTVPGRIAAIGTVAQAAATTSSTGGGSTSGSSSTTATPTVEVDIALLGAPAKAYDQAPVDVVVPTQAARNVVAVPVTALIALLGGGYAVEVPDGNATKLVAVTPGVYSGGYVEITHGLSAGDRVLVPQQQ